MRTPAQWLERYAELLESGLLSVPEVASAVLDLLAESPDRAGLWANAPKTLREPVLAYLISVGPDVLSRVFRIGQPDPEWLSAQVVRRREVAAGLLADADQPDV